MATWKDGAAYAPIERPDGFATPEVEPLEAAVPQLADTPGPMPPPEAMQLTGPSVPLEAIDSGPVKPRDPSQPFAVTSALITANDSPGGQRDPRVPFQSYGDASPDALPPPSGAPLPVPPSELPLLSRADTSSVPAVLGVPGPPGGATVPPPDLDRAPVQHGYTFPPPMPHRDAAALEQEKSRRQLQYLSVGVLAGGALWWAASPILMLVAGGLLSRVPHQKSRATWIAVGGGLLLLYMLVSPDQVGAYGAMASVLGITTVAANWKPPAQGPR